MNTTNKLQLNLRIIVLDHTNELHSLRDAILEKFLKAEVIYLAEPEEALNILKDNKPSIVIINNDVPHFKNREFGRAVQVLKEEKGLICYLILLATEEQLKELPNIPTIENLDLLRKPATKIELLSRLHTGFTILNLETEIFDLNEKVEKSAIVDVLTEVYTRQFGNTLLNHEINKVQRNIQELTVMMIDIDFLKHINNTYGYQAGNKVLKEVAKRILSAARSYDSLIRWGGEEFLIVCPHLQREDAIELANRTLYLISGQAIDVGSDTEVQVTISIGVVTLNRGEVTTPEELVEQTENAMKRAKRNERNQYQLYEGV